MSHRNPHTDLNALKSTSLPRHIQQLVNSARSQRPEDLIRHVRDGAMMQYNRTKREKQRELSPRINEARQTGDRATFKNAKKKVDNHASSVASRARRAFLIASYEKAVHNSMEERNQLAEVVVEEHVASIKKDGELRRLRLKLAKLMKENESMMTHISKSHSNTKSSTPPTRDGPWNQADLAMESTAQRVTDAGPSADPDMDQFDGMELGELGELGEPRFLNQVAPETAADGPQSVEMNLKMSSTEWEPLPLSAVQAQMKVDNPTGVFFSAV